MTRNAPPSVPVAVLRMEDLQIWIIERVADLPRAHKFTVGDRMVEAALDVTVHLVEAAYLRDKLDELLAASRALSRLRILVRAAVRLRLLSNRQGGYFAEQSDEVGRMIGGWTRSVRTPKERS